MTTADIPEFISFMAKTTLSIPIKPSRHGFPLSRMPKSNVCAQTEGENILATSSQHISNQLGQLGSLPCMMLPNTMVSPSD